MNPECNNVAEKAIDALHVAVGSRLVAIRDTRRLQRVAVLCLKVELVLLSVPSISSQCCFLCALVSAPRKRVGICDGT